MGSKLFAPQIRDRQPTRGGGGATPPTGIRPDDGPAGGVGVDESMQQIVNGLKYDTEKAARVASNEYWDGHNWDRDGRNTYLYKDPERPVLPPPYLAMGRGAGPHRAGEPGRIGIEV